MDRLEQVRAAADRMELGMFAMQCRRLEREYQSKKLRAEIIGVFEHLLRRAVERDKEAAWLGICVLDSSLVTGSHEILLSIYGSEFYFDPMPVESYWCPAVFGECMEEDMKAVIKALQKQYPRLWQYEEAAIRETCALYYHAALQRLCSDLGREVMATEVFRKLRKTGGFAAFFGRYHGEGEIIWRTGDQ